jgi:hypothetical protein
VPPFLKVRRAKAGTAGERLLYFTVVFLLMLAFPLGSIGAEYAYFHGAVSLLPLMGKWFVFWSVGIRLFLAGVRQFFQPRFTAEQIFDITSDDALPLGRELGVANFATGVVGMASLGMPVSCCRSLFPPGYFMALRAFFILPRATEPEMRILRWSAISSFFWCLRHMSGLSWPESPACRSRLCIYYYNTSLNGVILLWPTTSLP